MDDTNATAETLAEGAVTETKEPVAKDFVTLADDEDQEQVEGEAEGSEETEGDKEEAEDTDGEPKPKKLSGSARLKARLRAAEEELAEVRRTQASRALAKDDKAGDDLKEPKEADFPNDYLAYDRAMRAYETRKAIREEDARKTNAQSEENAKRAHRARLNAYNARLEDVRDRIPDYNTTLKAANDAPIRDDVRDLILDDTKGPLIAYHLAKNPEKLDALNRMTPIEAAREIGKLSARIRGPQVKTVTEAKPPLRSPKGGATGTGKAKDPSTMSMEEYTAWANRDFK